MSEENVEIVRRMLSQAVEKPDALYAILDDGVEWEARMIPGPGTYNGPDEVREFFRRWVGTFEDWGFEAEQWLDGGDAVVVRIHQWGRGKGSGVRVDQRFWQVWTLRDGKVIRATHHREKAEALEAAGLEE